MIITDNEFIDIPTPAGPMRTYVLYPVAEGRYPGIVLFSEIFQVTGPIRRSAALLAGHGFVVVVPEIFHELEEPGTVLPYDQAGADRGNADKINKELASYDADAKTALSYLKSHPKCTGKIGSMVSVSVDTLPSDQQPTPKCSQRPAVIRPTSTSGVWAKA